MFNAEAETDSDPDRKICTEATLERGGCADLGSLSRERMRGGAIFSVAAVVGQCVLGERRAMQRRPAVHRSKQRLELVNRRIQDGELCAQRTARAREGTVLPRPRPMRAARDARAQRERCSPADLDARFLRARTATRRLSGIPRGRRCRPTPRCSCSRCCCARTTTRTRSRRGRVRSSRTRQLSRSSTAAPSGRCRLGRRRSGTSRATSCSSRRTMSRTT